MSESRRPPPRRDVVSDALDLKSTRYTQHGDEMMICTCAEFGSTLGWPEHELRLTIDATKLVREAGDDRALARELGSVLLPAVSDLVLDLDADQRPPSPSALTMLEPCVGRPDDGDDHRG